MARLAPWPSESVPLAGTWVAEHDPILPKATQNDPKKRAPGGPEAAHGRPLCSGAPCSASLLMTACMGTCASTAPSRSLLPARTAHSPPWKASRTPSATAKLACAPVSRSCSRRTAAERATDAPHGAGEAAGITGPPLTAARGGGQRRRGGSNHSHPTPPRQRGAMRSSTLKTSTRLLAVLPRGTDSR